VGVIVIPAAAIEQKNAREREEKKAFEKGKKKKRARKIEICRQTRPPLQLVFLTKQ
jgi:hypothetical protein